MQCAEMDGDKILMLGAPEQVLWVGQKLSMTAMVRRRRAADCSWKVEDNL